MAVLLVCLGVGDRARAETKPADNPIPALDPSFKATGQHRVVLIMDNDIDPDTMELEEGQLVVWISYARRPSVVVFDREVARNMICHSLVNFSLRDGALRSEAIEPGESASFCELKPGRYEYRVHQIEATQDPDPDVQSLQGHLEVRASE